MVFKKGHIMGEEGRIMKKIILFLAGWSFGIWFLTITIFRTMKDVITNESAMAILSVIIVSVYTLVLGYVVGEKHEC